MKGAGRSIRGIAQELDVSRNTVRRYLKSPEAMRPKPRPPRGSKLDPYAEHIDRRMAEGLENCRVLDVPISQWEGVSTNDSGRVISLGLGENQLTGCVPISLWGQSRKLELGDLQFCQ